MFLVFSTLWVRDCIPVFVYFVPILSSFLSSFFSVWFIFPFAFVSLCLSSSLLCFFFRRFCLIFFLDCLSFGFPVSPLPFFGPLLFHVCSPFISSLAHIFLFSLIFCLLSSLFPLYCGRFFWPLPGPLFAAFLILPSFPGSLFASCYLPFASFCLFLSHLALLTLILPFLGISRSLCLCIFVSTRALELLLFPFIFLHHFGLPSRHAGALRASSRLLLPLLLLLFLPCTKTLVWSVLCCWCLPLQGHNVLEAVPRVSEG